MKTNRTHSEIRATCTKAARGAGCPWGLAEEAGMAAVRLQALGLEGAEALARLFETPRSCHCDGSGASKCGLAELAAFSDSGCHEWSVEGPIASPLLLAAAPFEDMKIEWDGGHAALLPSGGTALADLPTVVNNLKVTVLNDAPTNTSDWQSKPVSDDAWAKLLALAAKTYVPETDQSRASGAGPGDETDD